MRRTRNGKLGVITQEPCTETQMKAIKWKQTIFKVFILYKVIVFLILRKLLSLGYIP